MPRRAAAALLVLAGCAGGPPPQPAAPVLPQETRAQREQAEAAATLRRLLAAGRSEGLRWPDFGRHAEDLRRLYEPGLQLLWLRNGTPTPQARAVVRHVAQAGSAGLDASDYDAAVLAGQVAAVDGTWPPAQRARLDLALSLALLRNVSDLHVGRVSPRAAGFALSTAAGQSDLRQLVAEIARSDDVPGVLDGVEPRFVAYQRTREALARYHRLAADPEVRPPPDLVGLRPGQARPGVAALRRYLQQLGDALPGGAGDRYDAALVAAVERFQARHGLAVDGVVGEATARALAVPPRQRVRQIELALERWRWLPHRFERPPLFVNIPEFRLYALRDPLPGPQDTAPLTMPVIVGRAFETETPVFAAEMTHVVFRPYWNVPYSIARGEILPAVRRDPGYLARKDMELLRGGRRVGPGSAALAGLASGRVQVRQRPGPGNSLGLVKFMFPNQHDVYLHGTPAKRLFARARRDFSHGCIRVEDPVALGAYVLRGLPGWDAARVSEAMHRGPADRTVHLPEAIPVYILYVTAVARPNGEVSFYEDLYGHDAELARLLDRGRPYP